MTSQAPLSSQPLVVAYINIRGQTGLDMSKQKQIENYIQT